MSRKRAAALLVLSGLITSTLLVAPQPSGASSHREAPLISEDPTADNTDLYAFVSPDAPDTVTIIANYIPLQEPAGGPNFAKFGDDVLYEIHIDNDRDNREDITYQFRFKTTIRNRNTFLYNTGPIMVGDDNTPYPNLNILQTYDVTRVKNSASKRIARNALTPPVNIGPRSTPNYDALAAAAVTPLDGGGQVFAGQRDDPFFVDLGSIFDLGGLRPFNNFHLLPLEPEDGVDGVAGYNVHSIVMQVPISQLTNDGQQITDPSDADAVLGIYASASRQRVSVITFNGGRQSSGSFRQISRLGNPLVNEVIIPLRDKDRWNATDPHQDSRFKKYYQNPELAGLVNLLYPPLPDAPTSGRADLVTVLLTGVPGLNFTNNKPADLLRLNVAIPPTAEVGAGNRLGVLEADLAGFPNGRRLEDDVTDIELRAVACGYGQFLEANFGLCNLSPNNVVGDGVNANEKPFLNTFPYVAAPHQGYAHEHHVSGGD